MCCNQPVYLSVRNKHSPTQLNIPHTHTHTHTRTHWRALPPPCCLLPPHHRSPSSAVPQLNDASFMEASWEWINEGRSQWGDLKRWNVGLVTNMAFAFSTSRDKAGARTNYTSNPKAGTFNVVNLKMWDTSQVTDMRGMFRNAASFNGDISTFNTEKLASFNGLFEGAASFNGDLTTWSTSKVKHPHMLLLLIDGHN